MAERCGAAAPKRTFVTHCSIIRQAEVGYADKADIEKIACEITIEG